MNLAIFSRPGGRYIVRQFDPTIPGLWALLGPWYDREKAQKLANALTLEGTNAKRNRRAAPTPEETPVPEAAGQAG